MKKIKFDSTYSTAEINIIGISTPMPDYKLVWHLNQEERYNFVKKEDFSFLPLKEDKFVNFSFYSYDDKENYLSYCLIANKSGAQYLIPEFKSFDFLMFVNGNTVEEKSGYLISHLKRIRNIALIVNIELKKIKALDLILNDLEMFKLTLKKK